MHPTLRLTGPVAASPRERERLRLPTAARVSALLALVASCPDKAGPPAPKPCCDQPEIPAGVVPFTIVADESTGLYDERIVKLKAVLSRPAARPELYPVLHALFRHAMTREVAEPRVFHAEVYDGEAAARGGGPGVASIARAQGKLAPECENRVPYTFAEATARAFGELFLRKAEEDPTDSCKLREPRDAPPIDEGFAHRPALTVDEAARAVTLTVPFLKEGEDAWAPELKLTGALKQWIDYTTAYFRKVPDLRRLTFVGVHRDAPALRIAASKEEFETHLSGLQEDIAAYAAVTFQKLGMNAQNQAAALKEQEQFHRKTYLAALAKLPKDQVTIAKNLK